MRPSAAQHIRALPLNRLQQRSRQRLGNLQRLLRTPQQIPIFPIRKVTHLGIGFRRRFQGGREMRKGIADIGAIADGEQGRVMVLAGGEVGVDGGEAWG